jgi:hypothetical protein
MAYTILSRKPVNLGSVDGVALTVDITAYTTNGEDFSPSALGLERAAAPIILATSTEFLNLDVMHDTTNQKLKLSVSTTGVELGNGVDGGTWEMLILQP